MTKNVYIIVLNYKNLEDTLACLQSLQNVYYQNYHVVLVDNCSQDGSYEYLQQHKQDIASYTLLQAGKNRGYAAGNNVGIRYALEQGADYVCILNNDVEVEPDFLNVLVDYLETAPEVGVAGPVVYEYNQRDIIQSAGFSINKEKGKSEPLLQGKHRNIIQTKTLHYCDGMSGSCLLVKKEVLEKAGLIPECYFLFFEEMEWCLNIQKCGYKLATLFTTGIYHKGSATLQKTNTVSAYYMARSRTLFIRRNGNSNDLFWYLLRKGPSYIFRLVFSFHKVKQRWLEFKGLWDGLTMPKEGWDKSVSL